MIKIEKNIPCPSRRAWHPNNILAVMRTMEIGDSIFVPLPEGVSLRNHIVSLSSRAAALRKRDNLSWRFSVRSVEENGVIGVRMWRVDDKPASPLSIAAE